MACGKCGRGANGAELKGKGGVAKRGSWGWGSGLADGGMKFGAWVRDVGGSGGRELASEVLGGR